MFASSWSPSLGRGTTSDIFQAAGKTDDNKERFTISVRIGRIQGKASLMSALGSYRIQTPSQMEMTSGHLHLVSGYCLEAELFCLWEVQLRISIGNSGSRSCKSIKDCEFSETFAPTEVKNWLNSLVTSFRSLVLIGWEDSLRGMQFRVTFHLELVLLLLSSFLFANSFSAFLSSELLL